MSDTIIEVEDLGKKFCRSLKRSLYYGTLDAARAMVGFPNRKSNLRPGEFWALDGISFTLKRGDSLALIGPNGCGKTTLLRMFCGIFPPDRGRVTISGRVAALIAVGAGFHPHMSGAENIYLNGVLLGLSRAEIKSRFHDIVDFAGIGEFIEAPVSTYSSGMRVRLGFAIAVHTEPEVLLVDEVMSVGDTAFRRKASLAMTRILQNNRTSVVFVSHNAEVVKEICDSAMLIVNGKSLFHGDVQEAFARYAASNATGRESATQSDFQEFRVFSSAGENTIVSDEGFSVQISLSTDVLTDTSMPITVVIANADGKSVTTFRNPSVRLTQGINCFSAPPIPLTNGEFYISCKAGNSFHGASHHRNHRIEVRGSKIDHWSDLCYPLYQGEKGTATD